MCDHAFGMLSPAARGQRSLHTHLVETFIVDARAKNGDVEITGYILKLAHLFLKGSLFVSHEIHFVY